MGTLIIFAIVTLSAVALAVLTRTRYGELRLMEIPGFLWITLASKAHRSQVTEILASRKNERS